MVTDQAPDHDDQFEELAAGYALDALEPADEQLFLRHAQDCPSCTGMLASYREVAAAIASVVPPAADPSPQLADRIMATVRAGLDSNRAPAPATTTAQADAGTAPAEQTAPVAEAAGGQDTPSSEVIPLRPRRRWLRPATAAAAAALIAGGGIWAGLAASSGGSSQPTVANCQPQHGCFETALGPFSKAHPQAAKVLVQGKTVWMVPTNIEADNAADQIYVLWQIVGNHLHALGGFDVHPGGAGTEIKVGQLAAPYHGTTEFAISLEPGRTLPVKPTKIVAAGTVS